jgi:hypothetical protein
MKMDSFDATVAVACATCVSVVVSNIRVDERCDVNIKKASRGRQAK